MCWSTSSQLQWPGPTQRTWNLILLELHPENWMDSGNLFINFRNYNWNHIEVTVACSPTGAWPSRTGYLFLSSCWGVWEPKRQMVGALQEGLQPYLIHTACREASSLSFSLRHTFVSSCHWYGLLRLQKDIVLYNKKSLSCFNPGA